MLSVKQKLKLLAYALGIFVSYTLFGVLQEKIFRGRYGEDISQEDSKPGERFTFSVAFVAVQCVVYTLFAKGLLNQVLLCSFKLTAFISRCDSSSRSSGKRDTSKVLLFRCSFLRYSDGDIKHGTSVDFLSNTSCC